MCFVFGGYICLEGMIKIYPHILRIANKLPYRNWIQNVSPYRGWTKVPHLEQKVNRTTIYRKNIDKP